MTNPSCIPFPHAFAGALSAASLPSEEDDASAVVSALLDLRPLSDLSDAELEGFLYRSRMCPTRSRFMPGNAEWLTPRRDITVRVALETVRERMQQATACAELVARLERDYMDEDTLSDDDEALIVASAVRDNLREALGMLGVVEVGLQRAAQGGRYELGPWGRESRESSEGREGREGRERREAAPQTVEEALGHYEVLALAA